MTFWINRPIGIVSMVLLLVYVRKRVIIALDIPYPRIKRVLAEGQYKLTFTDVNEMRHSFIVMDTPAPKIEARLREFLKNRQAPQIPA